MECPPGYSKTLLPVFLQLSHYLRCPIQACVHHRPCRHHCSPHLNPSPHQHSRPPRYPHLNLLHTGSSHLDHTHPLPHPHLPLYGLTTSASCCAGDGICH